MSVAKAVMAVKYYEADIFFNLTVLEAVSIDDAARRLKKSKGTIYAARSRVMRRLREAIREFEESDQ